MKTVEDYEAAYIFEQNKNSGVCSSCGGFKVQPENVWFDEKGYGYSTKLTKCPHCGKVVILKYQEDYGFSKINTDRRIYFKNK